jgi:hypothetical protein
MAPCNLVDKYELVASIYKAHRKWKQNFSPKRWYLSTNTRRHFPEGREQYKSLF